MKKDKNKKNSRNDRETGETKNSSLKYSVDDVIFFDALSSHDYMT
jgi:hypothetical protein